MIDSEARGHGRLCVNFGKPEYRSFGLWRRLGKPLGHTSGDRRKQETSSTGWPTASVCQSFPIVPSRCFSGNHLAEQQPDLGMFPASKNSTARHFLPAEAAIRRLGAARRCDCESAS